MILRAVIEATAAKGKVLELEKQVSRFPNEVQSITSLASQMLSLLQSSKIQKDSDFVKMELCLLYVVRTYTHVVLITAEEDYGFIYG